MGESGFREGVPANFFGAATKEVSRSAFNKFLALDEQYYGRILAAVMNSLNPETRAEDVGKLADEIRVPAIDAREILLAASTATIIMVTRPPLSPSQFIEYAIKEGFISDSDSPKALKFLQQVEAQRPAIRTYMEEGQLAASVLPLLTEFDTAVELRFAFDNENKIKTAVPLLTVHLDTDTQEEVWFQIGTSRLERLIEDLQTALSQMKNAHEWYLTALDNRK